MLVFILDGSSEHDTRVLSKARFYLFKAFLTSTAPSVSLKISFSPICYVLPSYIDTVCPGSSDPLYIVTYYIKWGRYFLDRRYHEAEPGSLPK